jgi:hypothetical protein
MESNELKRDTANASFIERVKEIVNFDLNCKSFYNRTDNRLITTIIPSNFIAPFVVQGRLKEEQTSGKITAPIYLWNYLW